MKARGVIPKMRYSGGGMWLRLKGVPFMLAVYGRVANDAILVYERVTKNKRHIKGTIS